MGRDYQEVSRAWLDAMLDAPGVDVPYEPPGLYLCCDQVDGVPVFTACNNLDGQALTEDFLYRQAAVRWLHGYPIPKKQKWRQPRNETVDKARRLAELEEKTNK